MKFILHSFLCSMVLGTFVQAAEVKMKSLSYDPKTIEINQGESVTWKNTAYTDHSATSNEANPLFDTGLIAPGKERSVTFKTSGEFSYHCSIHGKTMGGLVIVKPAAQK